MVRDSPIFLLRVGDSTILDGKMMTMDLSPHKFEHYTMQHIDPLSTTTDGEGLVTLIEVYFDDFKAMIKNTSHAHLLQISCAILHVVHAIFPPPAVTDHKGFDPVALSKLETVEGVKYWNYH